MDVAGYVDRLTMARIGNNYHVDPAMAASPTKHKFSDELEGHNGDRTNEASSKITQSHRRVHFSDINLGDKRSETHAAQFESMANCLTSS
jgi:hypothetical protein